MIRNLFKELFNFIFVICMQVECIVLFMFFNKFLGFDKVSMCIIKDCFFVIFGLLIDIINCFFVIFIFLNFWRVFEVILLLKDGDYEELLNNCFFLMFIVVLKKIVNIILQRFLVL